MNPIYKTVEMNESIMQGKITLLSQVTPILELCYLKLVHVSLKVCKSPRVVLLESRRAIKAVSPLPHTLTLLTARLEQM